MSQTTEENNSVIHSEWTDTNIELTQQEKDLQEIVKNLDEYKKISDSINELVHKLSECLQDIESNIHIQSKILSNIKFPSLQQNSTSSPLSNPFKQLSGRIEQDVLVCIHRIQRDVYDLKRALNY